MENGKLRLHLRLHKFLTGKKPEEEWELLFSESNIWKRKKKKHPRFSIRVYQAFCRSSISHKAYSSPCTSGECRNCMEQELGAGTILTSPPLLEKAQGPNKCGQQLNRALKADQCSYCSQSSRLHLYLSRDAATAYSWTTHTTKHVLRKISS